MSIAKLILLIVILGALVVFALQNWLPTVPLVILGSSTVALPLAVWILGAIAAGALTTLVVTLLLRLGGGGNLPSRRRRPVQPASDRTEPMASGRADRFQWASQPFAAFNRKPAAAKAAARGAAADAPRAASTRPGRPADSWESFTRPRTEWEDWQRYEEPASAAGDRPTAPRVTAVPEPEFEPEVPPDTRTRIQDREDQSWSDWEDYGDYFESRGEDVRPMGDRAAEHYRETAPEQDAVDREEFDNRRRDRQYGHGWQAPERDRPPAQDWQNQSYEPSGGRIDDDYQAVYTNGPVSEPPLEPELVEEETDDQDYQDYIVDYGDEDEIDRYDRELEDRATYGGGNIADDFEDFDNFESTRGEPEAREAGDRPPAEAEPPRRPIQEIQREPKAVSQSGSLYSYSYRRQEPLADAADAPADAAEPEEYRVLTPPYRPDTDSQPNTNSPDSPATDTPSDSPPP